jgi:hypothetical protein
VSYSRAVPRLRDGLIIVILLVGTAGHTGCASPTTSAPRLLPPPPGEIIRSSLTSVALAPGRFSPKFDVVDGPAKGAGQGAARGALLGAVYTLGGGAFGGPIGLVASVFLAPVGAVGGGIVGGVTAESATKVEERVAAVARSLSARQIQEDLVDRVAAIGREETSSTFTLLAAPGERADYRALAFDGVQAVLEISVVELSLRGRTGEIDPSLALAMAVKTRLMRADDGAVIYANSLTYSGGKGRTLAEWLEAAELLQDELNRACTIVAEKIVDEVFLLVPFPVRAKR